MLVHTTYWSNSKNNMLVCYFKHSQSYYVQSSKLHLFIALKYVNWDAAYVYIVNFKIRNVSAQNLLKWMASDPIIPQNWIIQILRRNAHKGNMCWPYNPCSPSLLLFLLRKQWQNHRRPLFCSSVVSSFQWKEPH